jgi:hypothetical protein
MNFGNLCLNATIYTKKWRKSRSSSSYDNNCNSTITCFKSPKGLFLPKYHLIYKVEILKTALLNTIHTAFFLMAFMLFAFIGELFTDSKSFHKLNVAI